MTKAKVIEVLENVLAVYEKTSLVTVFGLIIHDTRDYHHTSTGICRVLAKNHNALFLSRENVSTVINVLEQYYCKLHGYETPEQSEYAPYFYKEGDITKRIKLLKYTITMLKQSTELSKFYTQN